MNEYLHLNLAAGNLKSLMDQLRSGELDNSDDFWTQSLDRHMQDTSYELGVSVQTLRGIFHADDHDYQTFWKKHGLEVMDF